MASFGPTELFVSNFVGIQDELGKLFSAHGSVQDYWISQKKGPRMPAGGGVFGVVRMATHEEALTAKKALHLSAYNGRTISIKWAMNQRVLWVGDLGPGVTNQVLEDAFRQFGSVERGVVVCDQDKKSRRFGFVTFERKDDAQRAGKLCGADLFLVGDSPGPVRVEVARVDDVDEGYAVDARHHEGRRRQRGGKGGDAAAAQGQQQQPGRFALRGSPEFPIAAQLRDLHAQYREAKARLKAQTADAAAMLLSGPHQGAPGRPGMMGMHGPPPFGPGDYAGMLGAPPMMTHGGGMGHEGFRHGPLPKRTRNNNFGQNRFGQPRAEPAYVPPPDLAFGGRGPPPSGPAPAFARGGQPQPASDDAKSGSLPLRPAASPHYRSAAVKASATPPPEQDSTGQETQQPPDMNAAAGYEAAPPPDVAANQGGQHMAAQQRAYADGGGGASGAGMAPSPPPSYGGNAAAPWPAPGMAQQQQQQPPYNGGYGSQYGGGGW